MDRLLERLHFTSGGSFFRKLTASVVVLFALSGIVMLFVNVQPAAADDGPWLRLATGSCDAPNYTSEVPAGSTLLLLSGGLMPGSPFEFVITPQDSSVSRPDLVIDQTVQVDTSGSVCVSAFSTAISDYGQYGITIHGLRANQRGYNTFTVVNIQAAPAPTETPSPTATATTEPTETPAPTQTPEPTTTAEPTITPTVEPTETPAPTQVPEPTVTVEPAITPTVELTETPAPTQTPEPTVTASPTITATAAPTETPAPTQTLEPTATATPTIVATADPTETPAPAAAATEPPTAEPTNEPAPAAASSIVVADTPTRNFTPRESVLNAEQSSSQTQSGESAMTAAANGTTGVSEVPTSVSAASASANATRPMTTNHNSQSKPSESLSIGIQLSNPVQSGIPKVRASAATAQANPPDNITDRVVVVIVAGLSVLVMCAWLVFRFR